MARLQRRISALDEAIIERKDIELPGLSHKAILKLAQPDRLFGCEIIRLGKVLFDVVKLPVVLVKTDAAGRNPGRLSVQTPCDPAIMVKRAVAEHFEVLGDPARRGVFFGQGVGHADALDWFLWHTVDLTWFRDTSGFENSRRNVDDMVKLRTQPARVTDAFRPGHNQTVSRAAEVRGDLFHPL